MLDKNCHITIPRINYPQVYELLMSTLQYTLVEQGIAVTRSTAELRPDCLNIIFAPWGLLSVDNESLLKQVEDLAEYCALFNVEQPNPEPNPQSSIFPERMIKLMRKAFNFDYYPEHQAKFERLGCAASTLRFLWHPSMRNDLVGTVDRDIDILFLGSYTPRRIDAFARIEQDFGLNVTVLNDIWGHDVDAYAIRSKIAINIKGNEQNSSFEVLRCLPMVANGAVVVSENDYQNIYEEVRGTADFCDLTQIGARCHFLLQNPDLLEATRQQQYHALVQTSFASEVQRGWSDWMQWRSEPLNRQTVGYYDRLNLSLTAPAPYLWRYDTLYLHDDLSNGLLVLDSPLSIDSLGGCIQAKSLNLRMAEGGLEQIETDDLLARVTDPVRHLQAWFDLLPADGKIVFNLPYYLSPMAYQYPKYKRPYSERSLDAFIGIESVYFQQQAGYFELENQSFRPTSYGASLLDNGMSLDIAIHTPNAISHVNFILVKRIKQKSATV
jgi:hypothetical protein